MSTLRCGSCRMRVWSFCLALRDPMSRHPLEGHQLVPTLWCHQSLKPIEVNRSQSFLREWSSMVPDGPVHSCCQYLSDSKCPLAPHHYCYSNVDAHPTCSSCFVLHPKVRKTCSWFSAKLELMAVQNSGDILRTRNLLQSGFWFLTIRKKSTSTGPCFVVLCFAGFVGLEACLL